MIRITFWLVLNVYSEGASVAQVECDPFVVTILLALGKHSDNDGEHSVKVHVDLFLLTIFDNAI